MSGRFALARTRKSRRGRCVTGGSRARSSAPRPDQNLEPTRASRLCCGTPSGALAAAPPDRRRPTLAHPRPGRADAAAAIWDWRAPAAGARPASAADAGAATRRGLLRGAILATVGALVFAFWSRGLGGLALALSALVVVSALVSPTGIYAALERGLEALTRATGLGLTWVFMSLIFFAIVTPFGVLFRRGARDPMRRFYEPDASTYWSEHALGRSASRMRGRQF